MINEDLRKKIDDAGFTNSIVYDNPSFDDSIIGVDDNGKIVYSFQLMIDEFIRDEMNETFDGLHSDEYYDKRDEAIEFIEYNTVRATPYMSTYGIPPLIIDYNHETDGYYDLVSGENYDLNTIDLKFYENYKEFLSFF